MGILDHIAAYLRKVEDREVRHEDSNTISFEENLEGVDASLFVAEPAPGIIYEYTPYLNISSLQGDGQAKSDFKDVLMERNADKLMAAYALTPENDIIVKGGFVASEDKEEIIAQFNDVRSEMRDLVEHLPYDLDLLNTLNLMLESD